MAAILKRCRTASGRLPASGRLRVPAVDQAASRLPAVEEALWWRMRALQRRLITCSTMAPRWMGGLLR